MATKEPVLLAVLVDAARERWFIASIGLDGAFMPMVRSADGDLAICQELSFDDQVSFLRHRFCGVLQRGCDRLWPVAKKACQFAFVFDGTLPGTTDDLTRRVAEHFAEWMLNPPAIVFTCAAESTASRPTPLAGTVSQPLEETLYAGLAALSAAATNNSVWEVSSHKGTWHPSTTA